MRRLAEGYSEDEVAASLGVRVKTIKNCHSSIFKKLQIHSNSELIQYAAKIGLIDTPSNKDLQ